MSKHAIAFGLALALTGCAHGGAHPPEGEGQPTYSTAATTPVITQVHRTGTVAPAYFHEDTMVVSGDGSWLATRAYPYTNPPSTTVLASGSLPADRLQSLVNSAFQPPAPGEPRFVDLPAEINDRSVGGGRRTITLTLESGTRSVSVLGRAPLAFQRLDEAIASATVPLSP
jgi:hypothetical protein